MRQRSGTGLRDNDRLVCTCPSLSRFISLTRTLFVEFGGLCSSARESKPFVRLLGFISLMDGTRGGGRLYTLKPCPALPGLSSAGACCLVRCVGAVPSFGTLHGYLCCDGAGDVPATARSTPVIVAEGVLGCMWCTQTIGSMVVHVEPQSYCYETDGCNPVDLVERLPCTRVGALMRVAA